MPIDSLNCYLITEVQNNLIPQAKSNVYPNPVSDYLSVVFINNERSEMFLYDISARKVLQINFINTAKFDTGQLEKGLYIYEIRSKNGICIKGKVMKD